MITLSQLTELLGWASVLNIGYLILASALLVLAQDKISSIHAKMFNLSKESLPTLYFNFLSNYKVLSLILCVFPYICLKIMGN